MELFSLEEDEDNELFITQHKDNVSDNVEPMEVEDSKFLGVKKNDSAWPCDSLVQKGGCKNANYSDISDDDVFIPCSQNVRLVF